MDMSKKTNSRGPQEEYFYEKGISNLNLPLLPKVHVT